MLRPSIPITALALAAALVSAAISGAPAGAAGHPGPLISGAPLSADSDAQVHTVRLITGDTVVVTGEGESATVGFVPADHDPRARAAVERHGDDITVIPESARELIRADALDERLFDIDALIEQGYAEGTDLPLIVQNTDGSARAPEGARKTRELKAVRGLAAEVPPENSRRLWSGLRARADGATDTRLADGVRKVWLDAKVKAQLDVSVPQIGAPEAWKAGDDGKGVKVAVLDTGIDATHPDLEGRITEIRNFSDSPDAVDRVGHGTHVASTIVGSGAASDGRYKGVAPGADVMVGKVLGDTGRGNDSSVLAGMEWAAHGGARVINMSLGAVESSDGTDPVSVAVDNLTRTTGALFVVGAGNEGPAATTLGTPGVADSALTVAAVDRDDKIASFSSRGPRFGDHALKPDIAGPGVDIVAARAAGTTMGTPVNAFYTAASGTSMATPHVAGAAALLAQSRPDWKAADLKGVLMSSAKVSGNGAFAEGSGRVDVPASLQETVWADNASFGRLNDGVASGTLTRTVTFHNAGHQDATLALAGSFRRDDGGALPGAMSLGADSITVPAGGAKDVSVTLDPDSAGAIGGYTGTITATGEGVAAHATVGFLREILTYTVRLKGTLHNGAPAAAASSILLYRLGTEGVPPVSLTPNSQGVASAHVLPGRYAAIGHLINGGQVVSFGFPDVDVTDHGIDLTVDGTKAVPVQAYTPRPTEQLGRIVTVNLAADEQTTGAGITLIAGIGKDTYALPSTPAGDARIDFSSMWSLEAPPLTGEALLRGRKLDLKARHFSRSSTFDGKRTLPVVDLGAGSDEDIAAHDPAGKLAMVRLGDIADSYTLLSRVTAAKPAAVMVVNGEDEELDNVYPAAMPVFGVPASVGASIAAQSARSTVTVRLRGEKSPSYQYQLLSAHHDGIHSDETYRPTLRDLAALKVSDHTSAADPATLGNAQESWGGYSTLTGIGGGGFTSSHPGTARTVYVTARDTTWKRLYEPASGQEMYADNARSYEPGRTYRTDWLKPVVHPGTPSTVTSPSSISRPARTRDSMKVFFGMGQSADGTNGEATWGNGTDTTAFRVYADGRLTGTRAQPGVVLQNLPDARTTYRFEFDFKRKASWWNVSTESHTAWTFASQRPAGEDPVALPVLEADYDLEGVRLDSSVSARASHDLAVGFRNGGGGAVRLTEAKVELSYDRGTTWTTPKSDRDADSVHTRVHAPKGATTVSLRISGTDSAGSSVEQTVLDAVRVR
ncbi:S8 family serine peptidase [Streptomyces sp. NPDC059651]|uniref:S8 family serine peptidase n=1 Tax=Streptomyces sp. NPDC059651 TaxID=3346897 RepID=UPI0036B656F1